MHNSKALENFYPPFLYLSDGIKAISALSSLFVSSIQFTLLSFVFLGYNATLRGSIVPFCCCCCCLTIIFVIFFYLFAYFVCHTWPQQTGEKKNKKIRDVICHKNCMKKHKPIQPCMYTYRDHKNWRHNNKNIGTETQLQTTVWGKYLKKSFHKQCFPTSKI